MVGGRGMVWWRQGGWMGAGRGMEGGGRGVDGWRQGDGGLDRAFITTSGGPFLSFRACHAAVICSGQDSSRWSSG